MPLHPAVKRQVVEKIEAYEGRVDHFYLDSVGKVTIGIGHLVSTRTAVSSIRMYVVKNGEAATIGSEQDKQSEYDNVLKQQAGYRASWYKQHTKLVMKHDDIDRLMDVHISSFYRNLINIYRRAGGYPGDFDEFPQKVQIALLDMIFNLGPRRLINGFPAMNGYIKAGNWSGAAQECNRPQVSLERNQYVRQLFLAAAAVEQTA